MIESSSNRISAHHTLGVALLFAALFPLAALGQTDKGRGGNGAARGGDRALIVVGLPGDPQHSASFLDLASKYRQWLVESLGFPDAGVRVLFGATGEPSLKAGAATREAIASEAAAIRGALAADGRLWVIIVGHAAERGGHAFLHLPGPDLREDELGKLFDGITCREQVFWITTAASGGFLRALSAKGRIVITATTADQEVNETEFPHALGEVCRQSFAELDEDNDKKVSVWELFLLVGKRVDARFAADKRTPTEHALLDDNGDQIGSERPDRGEDDAKRESGKNARVRDGELARKTILLLKTP
jgi:hypothetical protein